MRINSYITKEEKFNSTTKPHNLPIYATSSFNFEDINEGIDIFMGKKEGHVYGRYGNPTIETVGMKIAKMEAYGTEIDAFGIMVSSGMAAISTLVFAELQAGDVLLTQGNLYGGSTELFRKFVTKLGVELIMTDLGDLDHVSKILKETPAIRMIYCESPANPSLACVDIGALAKLAHLHNALSVIDNTFSTPYLQQPLSMGIDYSIHSTTKFLNGHGNSIAGAIIGKDKINYTKVLDAMKLIGTNCNAFDAWLINNGMKTLALRMDRHSSNALELSERLEKHAEVLTVNYPFLKGHNAYEIATRQMKQGGGMMSFELKGGVERGIRFMNAITMASLAPTLGDVDTLILHPASMSHRNIEREIRERNGITDGLIRMSVGIEDVEDLYEDIVNAIEKS